MAWLTNWPSPEVINLESEWLENNNSEQELGLNESFDYEARKIELSETITDPDFLEQALQELDELHNSFNSLNRDNQELTKLSLIDLQQEFDRDIQGIELLDNNDISSILPKKELIDYVHWLPNNWEEQFYSILSSISINTLKSLIIDYNVANNFMDKEEVDAQIITSDDLEDFIWNFFMPVNAGMIESQEVNELQNIVVDESLSQDSIEYYKQQIKLLQSSVSNDVKEKLDKIDDKLDKQILSNSKQVTVNNEQVTMNNEQVTMNNEQVTINDKLDIANVFINNYSDVYITLPENIKADYYELTQIFKEIWDIKGEINQDNLEQITALSSRLETILIVTDENWITVAEKFLQDLGKENPAMYSTLLQSFKDFSPTLAISLEKLSDPYVSIEQGKSLIESDTDKLTARLWNNFTVSGNIVSTDEMYVNYNENPPQTYMKFDNGLRLNSTVEEPAILEILENEIGELGKNISMIERNIQIKEAYNKLSLDSDKNAEILSKIETEYPELMNQSVSDLREVLNDAQSELKDKKAQYSQELNLFTQACENQDVKTKEIGEFLQGIWFNLIPTSITNNLLQQLNTSGFDGLRNRMGFNRKIDLDGGVLGYENSFDNKNITLTEKVIFAEFMNRMISWDIGEPLNIDNVRTWWGEAFEDRGEFQTILEKSGLKDSGTWISIALSNINNSFITKTTETKDKIEK